MTTSSRGAVNLPAARLDPSALLILAGFACMFVPIYWQAAHGLWRDDDQAQGALVLAVAAWLFWRVRAPVFAGAAAPASAWGAPLFALGLLLYAAGRAFDISIFEFASQPAVAAGALLLVRGRRAVAAAWFPLLYLLFMVPLPGVFVDALTGPPEAVDLGHRRRPAVPPGLSDLPQRRRDHRRPVPAAGRRRLLRAALDVQPHRARNPVPVAARPPQRRAQRRHAGEHPCRSRSWANVIRVVVLVLVTYHFGDEAGQGFLHGAAGIVLILAAVMSLFALDESLFRVLPRGRPAPTTGR